MRTGYRALTAGAVVLGWVGLLWVLEAIDLATGHGLDDHGISPREPGELLDIVPAAFLHDGWAHVASNSVPLLVLGFIAALGGLRRFAGVVLTVILIGGLGVWLTAPAHTVTLGASGVVFGLFGYLLVRGFVERSPVGVAVAVVIAAVWGTTFLAGALPTDSMVSWQAHLFGLLAGAAVALIARPRPEVAGI